MVRDGYVGYKDKVTYDSAIELGQVDGDSLDQCSTVEGGREPTRKPPWYYDAQH